MANFLEYLRQQNIFGSQLPPGANPIARPLPMGNGMDMDSVPMGNAGAIPPPQFSMPGIQAPDMARKDPWDVSFGPTNMPPTGNIEDTPSNMPTPGQGMYVPPEQDAGQRMRELYQPETGSTDRFNRMIGEYPQEQNPSWLRRIGAMVVDYTKGSKAGQEYFHEPYNKKVEEWKNKIGPAQQSANLERYENVNQRTLAYNQMSAELREKAQIAKEKNDTRRADILQQRADVYAFRAEHPDWKYLFPKGGNVQAVNPQNPAETYDTGIPTGSMTELDKIQMQGEQRMEQITASGAQARQTKEVPSGGASGKGMLPTQRKVEEFRRARELANTRPDLALFIKPGSGANEFQIVKPNPDAWTKSGKGPTPQQYSDIINAIYGPTTSPVVENKSPAPSGRSAGPGPGPAAKPPNAGTVRVKSKDGKTGTFKGTAAEAQAAGFIVIG